MPDLSPMLSKALKKIEQKGWADFQLADITDEYLNLSEIHQHFSSKACILKEFSNFIDQATLSSIDTFGANESQKDKLFSVVMTRLDVLQAHKQIIKSMWHDSWKDPSTFLQAIPLGLNSMTWLLQAAGIDTTGIKGALRTKAFALSYLNTIRIWLDDDSPEMDKTMAALDTNLQRLEQIPFFFQ